MVVHKADVWEGSTAKSVSESWTGRDLMKFVRGRLPFTVASVRLNFR